MTKHEELERAVERLTAVAAGAPEYGAYPGPPTYRRNAIREDLRLILSANREMRGAGTPGAAEAFDALDLADRLIERAYGNDVPREWNKAYRAVSKARSALTTQRGDGE